MLSNMHRLLAAKNIEYFLDISSRINHVLEAIWFSNYSFCIHIAPCTNSRNMKWSVAY